MVKKVRKTPTKTARLLPQHLQMLQDSAISPEVAQARGYRSIANDAKSLRKIGFSESQSRLLPSLYLPIWDVHGENTRVQLRPDNPRYDESGKPRKYENLPNVGVTLDINPLVLDKVKDWRKSLWITEGIKKEDALISAGAAAIGLYSVWNWLGTDDSGAIYRLVAWEEIPLKGRIHGEIRGRKVYIVFDSDVMNKRSVKLALERLGRFLRGRGADVRYVYLSNDGDKKVGIDDYLATGGSLKDLRKLAKADPEGLASVEVTARHLRDITQEVIDIMAQANDPAQIFRWGTVLTRVRKDEHDRPLTEPYDRDAMVHHMAVVADFLNVKTTSLGKIRTPTFPPTRVASNILVSPEWPFPILNGVVETPTLRPDGTILDHPGYDPLTKLLYWPSPDFDMASVPMEPTKRDVQTALKRLLYLVHDFPFVTDADLTNFIGLLLTPIVRPAIDGAVPLCGLSAPSQGSGKTLLGELLSRIATGRTADAQAIPVKAEEWPKTLISLLGASPAIVFFDNVLGVQRSGELAKAITTKSYSGRILGISEQATLPVNTTWVIGGNNLQFGGELIRRVYEVRIDPKMAKPWMRDEKAWLESDLEDWTLNKRGSLLWSLLVLSRSWWAAGCPKATTPVLGSFEAWSLMVGGILQNAGSYHLTGHSPDGKEYDKRFVGDEFLGNLEELYAEADIETQQWGPFLALWNKFVGSDWCNCSDVYNEMISHPGWRETLPDELVDSHGKSSESFSRTLGKQLGYRLGKRFECDGREYYVERYFNKKKKVFRWRAVTSD